MTKRLLNCYLLLCPNNLWSMLQLFSFVINADSKKLECLVPANFFRLVQYLLVRPGANFESLAPLGWARALLSNIRLAKKMSGENTLAFLRPNNLELKPFQPHLIMGLVGNTGLGWKGFPGTNPLAYLTSTRVTKKKLLMTLTPGANVIKLFLRS